MTATCPTCAGSGLAPADPQAVAEAVDELRRDAREAGYTVLPLGRVREDAAALLLGRSAETLRHWRKQNDERLPHSRDAAGRVVYRLVDIARFLLGENR